LEEILRDFQARRALLNELRPRIENLLWELLSSRGLRAHAVSARVKEETSLRRKLARHSPPYESLDRVTDLLAARVVTYFADELDFVGSIVEEEFSVDPRNSRDTRLEIEPERFGYQGLHYVVSISPARAALGEWTRFAGIRFEIQARDILQHAWAEIEHDRGYHTLDDVPVAVRRRWSRLAALLEIADSEFMSLRDDAAYVRPAGTPEDASGAGNDGRVPEQVLFTAVSSVGHVAPAEQSRNPMTMSITFRERPIGDRSSIRIVLESPDVTFKGTPIVTSDCPTTAIVESSRRGILVEVVCAGSTLPVVAITGLFLTASSRANPGPIQASVSINDGRRRSIASLGTVGTPTSVVVAVAGSPTLYAGLDDQATGLTTLVEIEAGTLPDRFVRSGRLRIRLVNMSDQETSDRDIFTRPPAIVVTRGDLKLRAPDGRSGTVALGAMPDQNSSTAEWAVDSASTIPATLEIRGTAIDGAVLPGGPLNGPRVNAANTGGTVGLRVEILDSAGAVVQVVGQAVVGFRHARTEL
jgi:ppGpp synthetase/RelA/SpoT-type nucleotidyltranferase